MAGEKAKLFNIQLLRFLAASMVVLFHMKTKYLAQGGNELVGTFFSYGYLGVDIFFVISGFIIYATSKESTNVLDFYWKRFTRIFSTYWMALILLLLVGWYFNADVLQGKNLWGSIFLLESSHRNCVLGVSWTLSFELYFYLFFGLVLLVGRKHILPLTFLFFLTNLLIAELHRSQLITADTLFRGTMIWEFCFGILVGVAVEHKVNKLGAWISLLLGVALLASHGMLSEFTDVTAKRVVFGGGGGTLIVFGAVQLEKNGWALGNNFFSWLGDASYSIYLLHLIIFMTLGGLGVNKYFAEREHLNGWPWLTMSFVVVMIVSLLFYWLAEKPVYNLLRRIPPSKWKTSNSNIPAAMEESQLTNAV